MLLGHEGVSYCNITIFVVVILRSHTETFFEFFLVPEALLRCRFVVVKKQNNCLVPSSVNYYQLNVAETNVKKFSLFLFYYFKDRQTVPMCTVPVQCQKKSLPVGE